jgi:hypothetical protein
MIMNDDLRTLLKTIKTIKSRKSSGSKAHAASPIVCHLMNCQNQYLQEKPGTWQDHFQTDRSQTDL